MTKIRLYGPADLTISATPLIIFNHIVPNTACPTTTDTITTDRNRLVSQLGQLALDLVVNLGGLLGLGELSSDGLLALVVCRTLNLASLLKSMIC